MRRQRGFGCRRFARDLSALRNEDGLRHTLIEGQDKVLALVAARVAEGADDGGVAALHDAHDAPGAASIGLRRLHFHQDLVALHGAVDLVWRNEDVVVTDLLARIGPDESEAVAMQIEPA